ncbi:hypothetical protein BJV74DRAFT_865557 [Russula compacta]|nr:hypothetical protein BJV74DRAFT_865557 [Russula compacta]
MPIILTDTITGERFCIKLYALVLEDLLVGMFIGEGGINFIETTSRTGNRVIYGMKFGNGRQVRVEHTLVESQD